MLQNLLLKLGRKMKLFKAGERKKERKKLALQEGKKDISIKQTQGAVCAT